MIQWPGRATAVAARKINPQMLIFSPEIQIILESISLALRRQQLTGYLHGDTLHQVLISRIKYPANYRIEILTVGEKWNTNWLMADIQSKVTVNETFLIADDQIRLLSGDYRISIVRTAHIDLYDKHTLGQFAPLTVDTLLYNLARQQVLDPTKNGTNDLTADKLRIRKTDPEQEWQFQSFINFAKCCGRFPETDISEQDRQALQQLSLLDFLPKQRDLHKQVIGRLLLSNFPGSALRFFVDMFSDGSKWLFAHLVDIMADYGLSMSDESSPDLVLHKKRLKLADIYSEYFLHDKTKPETKAQKYRRLFTILRILFDIPASEAEKRYIDSADEIAVYERRETDDMADSFDDLLPPTLGPTRTTSIPVGLQLFQGTGYGDDDDDCDPLECDSLCCCCDGDAIISGLEASCFEQVIVSCNRDGTGPAPGETFPPSCERCADMCQLVITGRCNELPAQAWWNYGSNLVCDCNCIEYAGSECIHWCVDCGVRCEAVVTLNQAQCAYIFELTPGSECCGESASCDCIETDLYVLELSRTNCEARTIEVCGNTVLIDPGDQEVCCEELDCPCDDDCDECFCGVHCTPVCENGELLFDTLQEAIDAVWNYCLSNAKSVNGDCITVEECGITREVCKSTIEAEVTAEWEACVEPEPCEECKCGEACTPVCPDGVRLFDTLEAAIENVWAECLANSSGTTQNGQCVLVEECDELNEYCRSQIEAEVTTAWEDCGKEGKREEEWEAPNEDCTPFETAIIGDAADDACIGTYLPDVIVLNNGIGLVAYESHENPAVIKIKQFKTSVNNKIIANRTFLYGRLQHHARWRTTDTDTYPKMYYYDDLPLAKITTHDKDGIAFRTGPLRRRVYTIKSYGSNAIGNYIEFKTPPEVAGEVASRFTSTDDVYNVEYFIYDKQDIGKTGSATVDDTSLIDLDATEDDINSILSLPAHRYEGTPVAVSRPSLAIAPNYMNAIENSHMLYVAYQAIENGKWSIYLRQLRLSEYKADEDTLLTSSNLENILDTNVSNLTYRCVGTGTRVEEFSDDVYIVHRDAVFKVLTTDGRDVFDCSLPNGDNGFSSGGDVTPNFIWVPKREVHFGITHSYVTSTNPTGSGPFDESILIGWARGQEYTVPLTENPDVADVFGYLIPTGEIYEGPSEIGTGTIVGEIYVTGTLKDTLPLSTGWCVFNEAITTQASLYQGIDISEPMRVSQCDGHATNAIVRADHRNNIYIAFECTETGVHEIQIAGTAAPSNALPVGVFAPIDFDADFNHFFTAEDFKFRQTIDVSLKLTSETAQTLASSNQNALNQMPDVFIDVNDTLHLVWQSNGDQYWNIYYANSDDDFIPKQITDTPSKSLRPRIAGDNTGNLYITWHDDRFNDYEIMLAYYDGSLVLPLHNQDPYLASMRNPGYTHYVDSLTFDITNSTNSTVCFNDFHIRMFASRLFDVDPVLEIKYSEFPFAFTIPALSQAVTGPEVCLSPGQSVSAELDLTPTIIIDKKTGETKQVELWRGWPPNQTYFPQIRLITVDGITVDLATQLQSLSCTSCSGHFADYSERSCSISFDIHNTENETVYLNARLLFYADFDRQHLLTGIEAAYGQDLDCFTVNAGSSASDLWTNRGLRLSPNEKVTLVAYPSLSDTAGLVCGITYYVQAQVCTSSAGGCSTYEDVNVFDDASVMAWICNCSSPRWAGPIETAPVALNELSRWHSSAEGRSDTRLTICHGNNLNPRIAVRSTGQVLVLYQSNRGELGDNYEIYGSLFERFPDEGMKASGSMRKADMRLTDGEGNILELPGRNLSFDLDDYDNVFLAYEGIREQSNFSPGGKQIVRVHRCGFELEMPGEEAEPEACDSRHITSHGITELSNTVFQQTVKKLRVKSEYVDYHTYREAEEVPVVRTCKIVFVIVGTPESVAIRLRNENSVIWNEWTTFNPEISDYTIEIPWVLTRGSGLKEVTFQCATYSGLATSATYKIIADYDKVEFDVVMYTQINETLTELSKLDDIPVASIPDVDLRTQMIIVDIVPSASYLAQFDQSRLAEIAPVFDVITQGENDQFGVSTIRQANEAGQQVYRGQFEIYRDNSGTFKDGLSYVVPHFVDDCSDNYTESARTTYHKDRYNLITPGEFKTDVSEFVDVWQEERDETGQIRYKRTQRGTDDPRLIFGDPNYHLDNGG